MKKIYLLGITVFLLGLTVFISSCGKDDDGAYESGRPYSELIIGKWIPSYYVVSQPIGFDTYDYKEGDCELNNLLEFKTDGTFILDDKCNEIIKTGTYEIKEGDEKSYLIFIYEDETKSKNTLAVYDRTLSIKEVEIYDEDGYGNWYWLDKSDYNNHIGYRRVK